MKGIDVSPDCLSVRSQAVARRDCGLLSRVVRAWPLYLAIRPNIGLIMFSAYWPTVGGIAQSFSTFTALEETEAGIAGPETVGVIGYDGISDTTRHDPRLIDVGQSSSTRQVGRGTAFSTDC